jgi:ABC-type nitrate/sulfonate/bicarbonate transport system permease component
VGHAEAVPIHFKSLAPILAGLAALAALAALLEAAVAGGLIGGFVVAPPTAIAAAMAKLLAEEAVGAAFLFTFAATFAASALAAAVGIPLGYLLYRRPLLGGAYENWIAALFSAPLILLYPMFLVVFGRSPAVCVAMGFLVGVIPVILKTREGFLAARPVLVNVARAFGANGSEVLRKVLLPAARPAIFTGLRLCLIYAMINVVGIEFLANLGGLGYLVGEMFDRYDIPAMYAAIVCLVLTSALFYALTGRAERWLAGR